MGELNILQGDTAPTCMARRQYDEGKTVYDTMSWVELEKKEDTNTIINVDFVILLRQAPVHHNPNPL